MIDIREELEISLPDGPLEAIGLSRGEAEAPEEELMRRLPLLSPQVGEQIDAIERLDYDVFRARACVSAPRKLVILGRAMWTERAGSAVTSLSERSA